MSKTQNSRSAAEESYRSKEQTALISAGNVALAANTNFNYTDALVSASFAKAAYSHSTATSSFLQGMDWVPLSGQRSSLEVSNAYAFSAKRELEGGKVQYVISFEGSNTTLSQIKDWVDNVAKYGWSEYYKALQPLFADVIHQALTSKSQGKDVELLVTGHSLGGAAATAAMIDLFLPKGQNLWPEKGAPLAAGSRIYEQTALRQWSESDIRNLLNDTQLYVFGAPSFLIDPNKLSALGLVKFGFDLVTSFGIIDFFYNFGKNVAGVLNVDKAKIPTLTGYALQAFQFEHGNSSALFGLGAIDPVAAIGSEQPGTQISINLNDAIYGRYGNNPLSLHSMELYVESLARAISGASLTKQSDPSAGTSILLPQYSNGTANSDRIINAPEGFGLAGNDLLIVSEAGNFVLNGGIGEDTFVISSYGANIRINGPADELEDALFFALDGTLTIEYTGESTLFKMSGKTADQVSTVEVDQANGYDITLVGIIQMSESTAWNVAVMSTTPPPAG